MVKVTQWCPTLWDPMDCSPPGFAAHGILQARIPEWISIPFSRDSSWPGDGAQVSCVVGRVFTIWATREAHTGAERPLIQYDWCLCEKRRGTEIKTHRAETMWRRGRPAWRRYQPRSSEGDGKPREPRERNGQSLPGHLQKGPVLMTPPSRAWRLQTSETIYFPIPEKHLLLPYWLCQSRWLCGSLQSVENSERDGNTRPPDLPLEKPVCRSGSNS